MNSRPLVSVVTVFHNRGAEVESSVGSLLAQTYAPLEIIVVDDGSTDDTLERLKRLSDPRLKVVAQANQGFTRSIDAAVKNSKGEFVAIHGAGDVSLPERLERQAQVLSEHPDVHVVGCFIDNEGTARDEARQMAIAGRAVSYLEVLRNYPMTHGEAMFRRATFDKVKGYRPFFQYAQDHDLWHRMDLHGQFWIVPQQLYVRRRFENAVGKDPIKLMLQAIYGDFAEQCIREREKGGKDLLDRYGNAAFFFAEPSEKLSRKLSSMGVNALLRGEEPAGRVLIQASYTQAQTSRTRTLRLLAGVSDRFPRLWRCIGRPVASRILQKARG